MQIKFGIGNQVEVPDGKYSSIGEILGDSGLRAMLGFSDNVDARIGGIVQPHHAPVYAGATVELTQKALSKA